MRQRRRCSLWFLQSSKLREFLSIRLFTPNCSTTLTCVHHHPTVKLKTLKCQTCKIPSQHNFVFKPRKKILYTVYCPPPPRTHAPKKTWLLENTTIASLLKSKSLQNNTYILPRRQKDYPVDFDDELRIGDVRYDNMTKITIKVQLFWRLPYET